MPLMIHNGKLLVRNGALALSPDCCCDCMTVELEVKYSVFPSTGTELNGSHKIFAVLESGATGCAKIDPDATTETMTQSRNATWNVSCESPCGTSSSKKTTGYYSEDSFVNCVFHYPYFTTGVQTMAAQVGYECTRYGNTGTSYAYLKINLLKVTGLPAGRTLYARYRRTGYGGSSTFSAWSTSQDATWIDPSSGVMATENGTAGTNQNIYVEIYFT